MSGNIKKKVNTSDDSIPDGGCAGSAGKSSSDGIDSVFSNAGWTGQAWDSNALCGCQVDYSTLIRNPDGKSALLEYIYDNGNRKTVVWVPDCGSTTYYFGALKDKEKEYLKQKDEVGEDILGPAPWYNAVLIAGEDSIRSPENIR